MLRIPERLFQTPLVDQRGFLSRAWMYLWRDTIAAANAGNDALAESAMNQRSAEGEPDAPILGRRIEDESEPWPQRERDAEDAVFVPPAPQPVYPDYGLLADIPQGMGTADAGRPYRATDYKHLYIWDGAAWHFAEGDGSGFVVAGQPDGSAPNGGVWGLCDGSAYDVALDDGTTASITTQNLTGDVFLLGGAPGVERTATAAKWDAAAKTDDESTHTHAIADSGTHTHAITAGSTTVQAGVGTDVASCPVATDADGDHAHSGATGAGDAHNHALTDANAKLKAPSEADGGLPKRIALAWYIRR